MHFFINLPNFHKETFLLHPCVHENIEENIKIQNSLFSTFNKFFVFYFFSVKGLH